MSSRQEDVVRSLLRPSENLQCLLDVELAAESSPTDQPDTPFLRRLITVITHRNASQDTEVGSLFVWNTRAAHGVPRVVDALPITKYSLLTIAQTGPIDQPANIPTVPTEKWSGWLLSIKRDTRDATPLAFLVRTRNAQNLQSLTAEHRRLKEIASATPPDITDFDWIEAYVLEPPSYRPDLRFCSQPLHIRLSSAIAGLPGDDASDISIVRRDWIAQAAVKAASTGQVQHLKIRLGTFNVNGKAPSQDLYPWLRSSQSGARPKTGWIPAWKHSPFKVSLDPLHPGSLSLTPPRLPFEPSSSKELRENDSLNVSADSQVFEDPDMLVLGFQELDLSTEALLYTTSTLKEEEWLTAIFAGLGEKHAQYEKLTSRQLVGMLLIVIVKKALVPCFTNIRSCDAGSGILGFMGNKGATAIRLEFTPNMSESSNPQLPAYRPTILSFVNAHLAASDEMVERRNYDFHELSIRLDFTPTGVDGSYMPTSLPEDTYNIYQSDAVFWMVHLNYRLDLPDEDIRELLFSHKSGVDNIHTLVLYDQLRDAMRNDKAFSAFREHPITHFPTYRLAPGLSKDRLGYDVKRKPAWTDRVLHMTSPDVGVAQLAYRSHAEITMSDHQPVSADFDVSLALIDRSKYENTVLTLHRELGSFEGSTRKAKIKVQPSSVDFGAIQYKQLTRREVVVQNEGDAPCVFRFVGTRANSESAAVAPPWLRIDPIVGMLRPHETMKVLLSAYVDDESAAELNLAPSALECTLILHTALGKDDFIAVSGNYQYTCFANTLARLTRLAGPIRSLKSPEDVLPAEKAKSAPIEIMRLVGWMMTHVSATDALFEYPAEDRMCHVIRECLDTGDEFPSEGPDVDHRALVAAIPSTLVALLDALVKPVVPPELHAECLKARDREEAFDVLYGFPDESVNVWVPLMACLHEIARQGVSQDESNPTGPSRALRLASIFAPVLLRDDPTGVHPRASPVGKRDFLLHCME